MGKKMKTVKRVKVTLDGRLAKAVKAATVKQDLTVEDFIDAAVRNALLSMSDC